MAAILALMAAKGGMTQVGLWSANYALFSFVRMADLGVGQSIAALLHPRAGEKRGKRLSELLTLQIGLILVIGIPATSALCVFGFQLLWRDQAAVDFQGSLAFSLTVALAIAVQLAAEGGYYALTACGRAAAASINQIAGVVAYTMVGAVVVSTENFTWLPWAHILGGVISIALCQLTLSSLDIRIRPRGLGLRKARRVLGVASGLSLTQLFQLFQTPLANMMLGLISSMSTVGQFELVNRVFTLVRESILRSGRYMSAVMRAQLPAQRVQSLLSAGKYASLLAIIIFVTAVGCATVAGAFADRFGVFLAANLLGAGLGSTAIAAALPSYFYLIAVGRTREIAVATFIAGVSAAALNIAAVALRSPPLIPIGLAAGSGAGMAFLIFVAHRGVTGWRSAMFSPTALMQCGALMYALLCALLLSTHLSNRVEALVAICAGPPACFCLATYMLFRWKKPGVPDTRAD